MVRPSNIAHNPYASNSKMSTLANLGARVVSLESNLHTEAENIKELKLSMTMKLDSHLDLIGGLQNRLQEMEKRLDVLEKKKHDKEEAKKDSFELVESDEDIEDREGPKGVGKGKKTR
jgi:hypothetical protein